MRYQSKTLKSAPNLDRKTALDSLKKGLRRGSRIENFEKKGNRWVASVRIAEFPPKKDEDKSDKGKDPFGGSDSEDKDKDDDDSGSDDDDDLGLDLGLDDDSDSDDALGGDGEVVDLLKQILEALGGGQSDLGIPPPPGDLGLDEGPPEGGPAEELGGLVGDDIVPTLSSQFKQVAGKLPTVTVSRPDTGQSVKQAKREIEAAGKPYGYSVTRAVREDGKLRVVASVR